MNVCRDNVFTIKLKLQLMSLKVEMHEQMGIVKICFCLLLSFVYCCPMSGLTNEHCLECL